MKKLILLIVFIFIVIVGGLFIYEKFIDTSYLPPEDNITQQNIKMEKEMTRKTYNNKSFGLNLTYPQTFTVDETKDDGNLITVSFSDKTRLITVQDYLAPSPDGYRIIKKEPIIIDRIHTTLTYYAANNFSDQKVTHLVVEVPYEKAGYTLSYLSNVPAKYIEKEDLSIFKEILASIKFRQ